MLITHTHIHRPIAKNVIFGFRVPQNMEIYQNLHFENLAQTTLYLLLGKRKFKEKGWEKHYYVTFKFNFIIYLVEHKT